MDTGYYNICLTGMMLLLSKSGFTLHNVNCGVELLLYVSIEAALSHKGGSRAYHKHSMSCKSASVWQPSKVILKPDDIVMWVTTSLVRYCIWALLSDTSPFCFVFKQLWSVKLKAFK